MGIQASKLLYWTPRGLEIILLLFAAWLLAGLFANNQPNEVNHIFMGDAASEAVKPFDAESLRKVALFGQIATPRVVKPTPQQPNNEPVKESRLQIKLIGTVVAGNKSAAMVSAGGSRKQEVFFLHEEMQPNVTLEEVEATAIVVSNHGKRERISIEAGKKIVQQAKAVVKPRRISQIPLASQVNRKINRQKLNSQMRNFSTLLSQARVSPHFSNGKPDGFTISEIVKGSLYEEIGLLNGDIIKAVNGESVTGAEQAMRMYRELQHATFIDVEVERAGSLQQISYVIQ